MYPDLFELSTVTLELKSSESSNKTNYRPIFILSHIAKLFDSFILFSIRPAINSVLIQVGHLSPLLFVLFINAVKRAIVNSQFLLFADQLKLFLKMNS